MECRVAHWTTSLHALLEQIMSSILGLEAPLMKCICLWPSNRTSWIAKEGKVYFFIPPFSPVLLWVTSLSTQNGVPSFLHPLSRIPHSYWRIPRIAVLQACLRTKRRAGLIHPLRSSIKSYRGLIVCHASPHLSQHAFFFQILKQGVWMVPNLCSLSVPRTQSVIEITE